MARVLKEVMFNDPMIMQSTAFKTEGYFHRWLTNTVDGRQYAIALVERSDTGAMVYVEMEQLVFQEHKRGAEAFI